MRAAVLGAGVIGSGWVARFLLHGWDVCVYDPAPQAQSRLEKALDQARRAMSELYDHTLESGTLTFAAQPGDTLEGVDWVQESLPEQLSTKRTLFTQLAESLLSEDLTHVPVASSTSGFKPSDLAAGLPIAAQMMVCHPFNPVYLIPAVEVVGNAQTSPAILDQAEAILGGVDMQPVRLQTEIDAHVADRLMEALWREALWLIKDDIATTAQIDAVIRNGFGLRWAQMGLFETYRLGGGEAGMRHFLAQFGPALQWPWSRLTDVPVMNEDLIEKIASQSDEQAGVATIEDLVAQRDKNLVAILRALQRSD